MTGFSVHCILLYVLYIYTVFYLGSSFSFFHLYTKINRCIALLSCKFLLFSLMIIVLILALCLSLISPSTAPPGINALEGESIALDMPSSYSTFHPPTTYPSKNFSTSVVTPSFPPSPPPQPIKPSFTPVVQPRELPRQRLPESFNLVTSLPVAFSLRSDSSVSLYRARMENRNVVLRVLKGERLELDGSLFVAVE